MTQPRLTYILGAGRSGSTVLERMLASAPGIVGVGEVATLWRLPLDQLTCSCGAPAPDCSFWRDVRLKAGLDDRHLGRLAKLETEFVRHRRLIGDALSTRQNLTHGPLREFLDYQAALLGGIAEVSGAARIIDSSKAAPRGWALSDMMGVSILHLRRNPTDVAASWRRAKHDPSLRGPMRRPSYAMIMRDWLTVELSARRLAATRPVIRVDYEALIEDPAKVIKRLGPLAEGVKLHQGRVFTPDPNYHSLNGNPDRFLKGAITVKSTSKPALSLADHAASRLAGAVLNLAAP